MTVTPLNYTLKDPDIEVVKFTGTSSEMEEIRDWVLTQLSPNSTVTLNTTMGSLSFTDSVTGNSAGFSRGNYIVKDSNGTLLRIDEATLKLFYAVVV